MRKAVCLLWATLFGLAACGLWASPSPREEPQPTPVPPTPTPAWPAEAQPLVEQVLADVSARAQVSPKDVQVVRVEAVDWPDSCLGCTHPGQACLEVITPGYRILVRAAGQEYEYHASRTEVVFCPQQQPGDWGEAQPQVERVVADLAARLGISPEEIVVQEVREVEWRDSSLGCPKPGYGYLQVITPGYQILLQARGRTYDYRTDRGEIFLLCEP